MGTKKLKEKFIQLNDKHDLEYLQQLLRKKYNSNSVQLDSIKVDTVFPIYWDYTINRLSLVINTDIFKTITGYEWEHIQLPFFKRIFTKPYKYYKNL